MNKKMRRTLSRIKHRQEVLDRSWDENGNKELLRFFVDIVPRLVNAERCSIFISDPSGDRVWLECGTGLGERNVAIPKRGCIVGEVISSGRFRIEEDLETRSGFHKQMDDATNFVTKNVLCVPVKSLNGDQITGAIQILNKKDGTPFSTEDRLTVERVAYHLELAIENLFHSQTLVDISDQLSRKVDFAEFIIKVWVGFIAAIILAVVGVVFYFTPIVMEVFTR
ncbi:MAG: GAF domain-containing protein [Magnetococcales bacterium]|nr:GAF domain-containing protein [Magnetococcales bacterium]